LDISGRRKRYDGRRLSTTNGRDIVTDKQMIKDLDLDLELED
jgi:hypothetical protein